MASSIAPAISATPGVKPAAPAAHGPNPHAQPFTPRWNAAAKPFEPGHSAPAPGAAPAPAPAPALTPRSQTLASTGRSRSAQSGLTALNIPGPVPPPPGGLSPMPMLPHRASSPHTLQTSLQRSPSLAAMPSPNGGYAPPMHPLIGYSPHLAPHLAPHSPTPFHVINPITSPGGGHAQPPAADQRRRNRMGAARGPPVHTPLQSTGHNSKPSISLSPAVFASFSTERQRLPVRRKILVSLPRETLHSEEAQLQAQEAISEDASAVGAVTKASAQHAADIRKRWEPRIPVALSETQRNDVDGHCLVLQHNLDLHTAPEHPDPWPSGGGLPDIIDVYLPGQNAWEDCKKELYKGPEPSTGITALSESTLRAHDRSVSTASARKVQHYLAATNSHPDARADTDKDQGGHNSDPGWSHRGQTMSLSLPVSGDNFATGALSALGLGSSSQSDDSSTSGLPPRAKSLADTQDLASPSRPVDLQSLRRDSAPASLPGFGPNKPSLKIIGAGFGYELGDVPEEEDDQEREMIEEELRTNPSQDADTSDQEDVDEVKPDLDARINPDTSEERDDEVADKLRNWRPRPVGQLTISRQGNRPPQHLEAMQVGNDQESDNELRDDSSGSNEELEFSNPSDEDAARQARAQRRRSRADMRGDGFAHGSHSSLNDASEPLPSASHPEGVSSLRSDMLLPVAVGRPRADTADTYASSSLHAEIDGGNRRSRPVPMPPRQPGTIRSNPSEDGDETGTFGDPLSGDDHNDRRRGRAPAGGHFRLPSINHSSFGSSAFDDADERHAAEADESTANTTVGPSRPAKPRGNEALSAPFTFTLPSGAPKLPELDPLQREQGREKRYRLEQPAHDSDSDSNAESGDDLEVMKDDEVGSSRSPSRPTASPATVEGGLRGAHVPLPPPFNPRGLPPFFAPPVAETPDGRASQAQANGSSRPDSPVASATTAAPASLRPSAPSFLPTWAKNAPSSLSRPPIPFFGPPDARSAKEGPNFTVRAPSGDFTFTVGSKAIPIRRPEERPALVTETERPQARGVPAILPTTTDDRHLTTRERPSSRHVMRPLSRQTQMRCSSPTRERPHAHAERRHESSSSIKSVSEISDTESLSEFVDELAARVDESLAIWASKILQHVTATSHARNAGPGAWRMAEEDRLMLVNAIATTVDRSLMQRILALQNATLEQQRTLAIDAASRSAAAALAITDGPGSPQSPKMALTTQATQRLLEERGMPYRQHHRTPKIATTEADFDYVSETLDVKLKLLKCELVDALKDSFSHAVRQHDKSGSTYGPDSQRVGLGLSTSAPDQPRAPAPSSPAEGDILQKMLQKFDDWSQRNDRSDAQDRQSFKQSVLSLLDAHAVQWDRSLMEMRETMGERIEVILVNTILPHLDVLLSSRANSDGSVEQARAVTSRVTELLAPVVQQLSVRSLENGPAAAGAEQVAEAVLGRVLPLLRSLKFGQDETQRRREQEELVQQLSNVIRKAEYNDAGLDLDPITALLEPLVDKQEAVRSATNKLLDKQGAVEKRIGELVTAVSSRMDRVVEGDPDRSDALRAIQTQMEQMALKLAEIQAKEHTVDVEKGTGLLLEDYRRQVEAHQAQNAEMTSNLATANEAATELKVELARVQQSSIQAEEHVQRLRKQESLLSERLQVAEARAMEAETKAQSVLAAQSNAEDKNKTLQSHIDQLVNELNEARQERARERESSAQATAELLVRLTKADAEVKEGQERFELLQKRKDEELRESVERAALAEGEAQAMQKRITDQDTRVSNLQALTSTQKQRAAEAQQKLADAAKRTVEFEAKSEQLTAALAKLETLESRAKDGQRMEDALRAAEEEKGRLREELSRYHDRFLELEHDLVAMKERFVERGELEAVNQELAASQGKVALLQSQLAERERRDDELRVRAQAQAQARGPGGFVSSPAGSRTHFQHHVELQHDVDDHGMPSTTKSSSSRMVPGRSASTQDSSFEDLSHSASSMWASVHVGGGGGGSEVWDSPATHLERSASYAGQGGPGPGPDGAVAAATMTGGAAAFVPVAATPSKHRPLLTILSDANQRGQRGPPSAAETTTSLASSGARTTKTAATKTSDGWWT
ncbi:unnamed protein product [Parajaminaea phylloscopi]